MTAPDKDTIYIDIDDEITGIIDKLKASDSKVVALVLPKRAAVFQSIVNMKLLKRAADGSKKHLVLITSEAGLLPLAGAAGVHVAKTLTSKPEIPLAPTDEADKEEAVEETIEDTEPEPDTTKTVGQLAGTKAGDEVETLVLDDEDLPPELADDKTGKDFKPSKKKNKKLKIPNFDRFRLLLVLGALLLILLISGVIFAATALPKAVISIKTDATTVDTRAVLNLAPNAKALDADNGTIPAKQVSQQKTYTQQVPTTGQKNNGNKASGNVTVTNCSKSDSAVAIPAGTGFSSSGNTYISQESVTVPPSDFTGSGNCKSNGKESVDVIAQNGGSSYNLPAGATFVVANGGGQLSAQGGTISGGTDNIVQTVNQNDINNAKAKIAHADAEMKQTLDSLLRKDNLLPLAATFAAGEPAVTQSAKVGEVATSVTVTEVITYTMFGVKQDDLKTLVEDDIKNQIDTTKQTILDNGLAKANFSVENLSNNGGKVTVTTVATAGPDLDVNSIRALAAGKKAGAIKSELQNNPDVVSVDVKLSPFWVSSVPKKQDRIKVDIAKPEVAKKANDNADR